MFFCRITGVCVCVSIDVLQRFIPASSSHSELPWYANWSSVRTRNWSSGGSHDSRWECWDSWYLSSANVRLSTVECRMSARRQSVRCCLLIVDLVNKCKCVTDEELWFSQKKINGVECVHLDMVRNISYCQCGKVSHHCSQSLINFCWLLLIIIIIIIIKWTFI